MLQRDGVEQSANRCPVVVRHRLRSHPLRPEAARERHHLGTDLVEARQGALLQLIRRDLRLHEVAELVVVEVAAQPKIAGGVREKLLAQPFGVGVHRLHGRPRRLLHRVA